MPNPQAIAEQVALLIDGKVDYKTAMTATGCAERTLQRYVAAERRRRAATPAATPGGLAEGDTPAAAGGNPAVEAARRGAGLEGAAPGKPAAPAVPGLVAADKQQKFVLDTVQTVQGALVEAFVIVKNHPPLKTTDPRVKELSKLSVIEEQITITNTERLYPYCVKMMNGLAPFAVAMGWGAMRRYAAVDGLAAELGYVPGEKTEEIHRQVERPRPPVPPPAPVKKPDVLNPAAPPPAPGSVLDVM